MPRTAPVTPIDKNIGRRIRAAREARGIRKEQLALELNVAAASITHWEVGLRRPSFENMRSLARALGTTMDWLVEGVAA